MGEMIEHEGVVRSVSGGKAVIAVHTGGCGGCGHQAGCGLGRLAGKAGSTALTLPVDESIRPGAQVLLSLPAGRLLRGALLAYLLPALSLLIGAGVGAGLGGSDGAAAVGAALGLLGGFLLTWLVPAWKPLPQVQLAERPAGNPQFRLHVIHDKVS